MISGKSYFDTTDGKFAGFILKSIIDSHEGTTFKLTIKNFTKICRKNLKQ